MTGRRAAVGLCMLCALAFSTAAAQSASAVGTTAYTCQGVNHAPNTAGFLFSHCKGADAVSTEARYEHVSIPSNTTTEFIASDRNTIFGEHTGAVLRSTVAGSGIELVALEVNGSGTMKNSEELGTMVASGEGKIAYSGVTEKLLGCKVTGKPGGAGTVETKQLFASTQGVGDKLKFTPKEGTVFAEFELTECAVGPTTVRVVGSVLGIPDGATINTEHKTVTEEITLRLQSAFGPVAGIAGTLTISGRANIGQSYTPLSVTT